MRKVLNGIVMWLYGFCVRYIDRYIYIPKHADKEFWGDDVL